MALSADDRLLGEKMHYYCSSSEDEGEEDDNEAGNSESEAVPGEASAISAPEIGPYKGFSTNTGPKGVVNDWRKYKQLETEKREEAEREKLELISKLSITCRSHLDDEKDAAKDKDFRDDIDKELDEIEDEFLREYREKRLHEMRSAYENTQKFGAVKHISHQQFLEEVDSEKPSVTIVVHLYEKSARACVAMARCMACLAQEYPTVKFCQMDAHSAKLSHKFLTTALPALLVYKGKEVVGNFIRLSDEFGEEFFASDVESFLLENGMLPDKTLTSHLAGKQIRQQQQQQDSDSDFDID